MRTINGDSYSPYYFDSYTTRVVVEVIDNNYDNHSFDIYTTQTNKDVIIKDLKTITTSNVVYIKVIHVYENDTTISNFLDII
jgi:hypothetical protein